MIEKGTIVPTHGTAKTESKQLGSETGQRGNSIPHGEVRETEKAPVLDSELDIKNSAMNLALMPIPEMTFALI